MQTPEFARTPIQLAVDEVGLSQALQLSVSFLQKDRCGRRLIPFYRIGGAVRYNIDRVREALAQMEEGGPEARRRRSASR